MDNSTRQAKRAPVTLKIKFKSETLAQFIERYAVDVSPGGIFIRTKEPLAVGTPMKFEFQLRDATPLITGEGTVVWTRENDPARPNAAPGMGVRFDRLGDGSQPILDKILAEKNKAGSAAASAGADQARMFTDQPTRVAPSPLVGQLLGESRGKLGDMAPPRAGFGDERTDTTPLPRPMPFHSDAEEFPDETFEEATKVRTVEDLIAATGQGGPSKPLSRPTMVMASPPPPAPPPAASPRTMPPAPPPGRAHDTSRAAEPSTGARAAEPAAEPMVARTATPGLPMVGRAPTPATAPLVARTATPATAPLVGRTPTPGPGDLGGASVAARADGDGAESPFDSLADAAPGEPEPETTQLPPPRRTPVLPLTAVEPPAETPTLSAAEQAAAMASELAAETASDLAAGDAQARAGGDAGAAADGTTPGDGAATTTETAGATAGTTAGADGADGADGKPVTTGDAGEPASPDDVVARAEAAIARADDAMAKADDAIAKADVITEKRAADAAEKRAADAAEKRGADGAGKHAAEGAVTAGDAVDQRAADGTAGASADGAAGASADNADGASMAAATAHADAAVVATTAAREPTPMPVKPVNFDEPEVTARVPSLPPPVTAEKKPESSTSSAAAAAAGARKRPSGVPVPPPELTDPNRKHGMSAVEQLEPPPGMGVGVIIAAVLFAVALVGLIWFFFLRARPEEKLEPLPDEPEVTAPATPPPAGTAPTTPPAAGTGE